MDTYATGTLTQPLVRTEGVNFFYGEGEARNQVLFDVAVEVMPGQLAVMTGPSGSGKTTLLTLIGGLRSVQEGRIDVLGHNLAELRGRDLVKARREIGFIFQMHNLFESLTAYENVQMALQLGNANSAEMRRRGVDILKRLGLGARIDYKPRQLSGGQRQRVAIGRALANRPKLVLADEPTAALDRDSTHNVVNLLKNLSVEDGSAILMVTHDHRIIDLADRIIHMVDGRIVSDVILTDVLRICEFLKEVEAFKNLSNNELANVAERVRRRHYEPGEVIIREGDVGEELFLIAEGEVEIVRHDQEVARLGSTEFFGEVALISGEPRNATAVAVQAVETFVLGKADFQAAMEANVRLREQLRRVYFQRH